MGIPDYLTCFLRSLYTGQEATVRTKHGTDWFQIEKEYIKAVYCHPAYSNYMQSTSCEMLGWGNHKLESRLLGEISITSYMQVTPPRLTESEEELKSLLMKLKEKSKNACSKLNTQKTKIMASDSIRLWHIGGGKNGNSDRFYFWGLPNHCRW